MLVRSRQQCPQSMACGNAVEKVLGAEGAQIDSNAWVLVLHAWTYHTNTNLHPCVYTSMHKRAHTTSICMQALQPYKCTHSTTLTDSCRCHACTTRITHTHTHTHTHTQTHTHSHTHTHTHTHTNTNTHTYTHTHTFEHAQSIYPSDSLQLTVFPVNTQCIHASASA